MRLGCVRGSHSLGRLVLSLKAEDADENVGTTSNDVPSCNIGDRIIQERRKTMNYTKPRVANLGDAFVAIETTITTKGGNSVDMLQQQAPTPAYDLDE